MPKRKKAVKSRPKRETKMINGVKYVKVRRRQAGGSFASFWKKAVSGAKKANKYLRKKKLISKIGGVLTEAGVPFAGNVTKVSKQLGYGIHTTAKPMKRNKYGAPARSTNLYKDGFNVIF